MVIAHEDGLSVLDTATGEIISETDLSGFQRLNNSGDGRHVMVTDGNKFVAFDAALNIVNRRSMDNDYGIGPQQSAASGLPVYSPSAGLREFAVSATLVHEPDNHWVWMTRFSLVRLVGEAAASPLVKQKLQPELMFGVAYRFTWD